MILATGVSGGLGGLVADRLTGDGTIDVLTGSSRAAGAARRVDFDDPATLVEGFDGVDVLVVISAGYAEDDVVLARHGAVIAAAAAARVRHVIYTSLAGSGDQLSIALAHRWTEARLAEAPFSATVLRNGLYAEVPVGLALAGADAAAATGVFRAPLGTGRVPVVAREDLADATARVALEVEADLAAGGESRHAGRTYELEGATTVGGEEIAAALGDALGRAVRYEPTSLADTRAALTESGLEPYQVAHSISLFANILAGTMDARDSDLPALLDGEPRPVLGQIADVLAAGGYVSQSVTATTRSATGE